MTFSPFSMAGMSTDVWVPSLPFPSQPLYWNTDRVRVPMFCTWICQHNQESPVSTLLFIPLRLLLMIRLGWISFSLSPPLSLPPELNLHLLNFAVYLLLNGSEWRARYYSLHSDPLGGIRWEFHLIPEMKTTISVVFRYWLWAEILVVGWKVLSGQIAADPLMSSPWAKRVWLAVKNKIGLFQIQFFC